MSTDRDYSSRAGTPSHDSTGDSFDTLNELAEDEASIIANKDAILFVVDCNEDMLSLDHKSLKEDESQNSLLSSQFSVCLRAIMSTYKNKIISSPDDYLGVIFYNTPTVASDSTNGNNQHNTVSSSQASNFAGIRVFLPLDQPDAQHLMMLKNVEATNITPLETEVPLGNVFWTCASLLSLSTLKYATKRVFLFTNQDNPNKGNATLRRAARTRARDLQDLGIELELFPLNLSIQRRFDLFHFYRDVIINQKDDGGEEEYTSDNRFPVVTEDRLAALEVRIRRKEAKKRALVRLNLNLGPDLAISVRVYNLVQEAKRPSHVWMDADTNTLVKGRWEYYSSKTGKLVDLSPVVEVEEEKPTNESKTMMAFNYGGREIFFTSDQVRELKFFGEPSLSIICFLPLETVKLVQHHMQPSSFLVPDDLQIQGSAAVMVALIEDLAQKQLAAICKCLLRRTSFCRLALLIPQPEQLDECGYQVFPGGFHLLLLPFREEIRHLEFASEEQGDEPSIADEVIVDKAKEIINKLVLGDVFDPQNLNGGAAFDNPQLHRFYSYLQALALDEENLEPVRDGTVPNYNLINKRAGKLIDEFLVLTSLPQESTKKRKIVKSSKLKDEETEKPIRKRKVTKSEDIEEEEKEELLGITLNNVEKAKVNELKAFLQQQDITPKRLKADLIQQVKELLDANK